MGGDLVMSKKERDWFRVLERAKKKEITLRQAAQIMVGSYRQCLRKYKRYAQEGAKARAQMRVKARAEEKCGSEPSRLQAYEPGEEKLIHTAMDGKT